MINLFEVKNYLLDTIDIDELKNDSSQEIYRQRRQVIDQISYGYTDENNEDSLRISTLASILLDIIDFVPKSYMLLPGGFIQDSYHIFRDIVYTRGTSIKDIELSIARFTEIYCGELGLYKLGLRVTGNWTNSCTLFEKVIRGLSLCGWKIEEYDTTKRRLIFKKEKEID